MQAEKHYLCNFYAICFFAGALHPRWGVCGDGQPPPPNPTELSQG